jgi:hypothetical protein
MTPYEARDLADTHGFPLNVDFHTLTSAQVYNVLAAADFRRYRKSRNAPGSRARMFHAYLCRVARRED